MQQKKHKGAQCGSPSARDLASFYLGASVEEESLAASCILQDLETSGSALAGCFRSFLQEAGIRASRDLQEQQQQKRKHEPQVKLPDTELLLQVTLEDLYNGAVKWVPIERKRHDGLGHVVPVQERLQVRVQPGIKEGTRITLPGLGNEDYQGNMSDLTFIVQQQLHPAFRRLKDDLYAIVHVPLVTALTGGPVSLTTLGGQLLQLPVGDGIITPGSELVVPNHGMPVFGDSAGRRGALHVKFNVRFPQHLSQQQQALLRHTLADCEFLPRAQHPAVQRVVLAPVSVQQQRQQRAEVVCNADEQQQQQQRQWQHASATWQHAVTSAASDASAASAMAAVATVTATTCAAVRALAGAAGTSLYCAAAEATTAAGSSAAGSAGSSSVAGFACMHSTGTSGARVS